MDRVQERPRTPGSARPGGPAAAGGERVLRRNDGVGCEHLLTVQHMNEDGIIEIRPIKCPWVDKTEKMFGTDLNEYEDS